MNILFINGSPKVNKSASGMLLDELRDYMQDHAIVQYSLNVNKKPDSLLLQSLSEQDIIVISFPLYVDSIPSHFLYYLTELENYLKYNSSKAVVYAIINCGFYEGHQNRHALEILKIWCEKANLKWGQGIGIGAGGMLAGLGNVPKGKGPRKNASAALLELASNAAEKRSGKDIYASPNFPRFLYKIMGDIGWRTQAKRNGLKTKDIFLQR